jgi:hypothetical protein
MTIFKKTHIPEEFAAKAKAFLKILQQAKQQSEAQAHASATTKTTKASSPLPKLKNG